MRANLHPARPRMVLVLLALSLVLLVAYLLFAQNRNGWSALFAGNTTTAAVWTYHNDNLRSGQNRNETILNTGNVNAKQFGKRVAYPVDGQVYAQPLFVPGVTMRGHRYNVVYAATENDSVYAFDADQRRAVAPLWKTSFLHSPDVTAVPPGDVFVKYPNHDIEPFIGITSTPVIDLTAKTLYVVAMTKQHGDQYVQQLHALDIMTGKDRQGSPLTIFAAIKGEGYDRIVGPNTSLIPFNSREGNQRAALLLANGVIYITWGGFGDTDPYHGWIVGYTYNGKTFRQVAVYNTTPDGQEGGIWMSGAGPSADGQGNVYLTTGNGTFDLGQAGQRDAGDSFIKLSTRHGLALTDYFTPFNQQCLDGRDEDLGSGGVLLLPDQSDTSHPHLIVAVGKEGRIYVIDRDHMGQFHRYPGDLQCSTNAEERTDIDHVIQEFPSDTTGGFFGTPAYWVGTADSGQLVYIGRVGDQLKSYQLSGGTLSTEATAQTPETFSYPGVTPSISSNQGIAGTGIVWVISPGPCNGPGCAPRGPGVLRAYDATNIGKELYNSKQNLARDGLDSYVKFSVPTIANGKVFVGTQTCLTIYGLLP